MWCFTETDWKRLQYLARNLQEDINLEWQYTLRYMIHLLFLVLTTPLTLHFFGYPPSSFPGQEPSRGHQPRVAVHFEVYDSPLFDILSCVTYPPPPPIFGYTPLQFPNVHHPEMEITPLKMLCSCPCGMLVKNNNHSRMQSYHTLECVCQCTVHILGDPPQVFSWGMLQQ